MSLLRVGWTSVGVVVVGGSQRVTIGVDLQGEGFGRSAERDPLWGLLLLGLCVLCVVLGLPLPFAEELVQGSSFLLQRCILPKMMFLGFLGWKWWATGVAPRESSLVFCYGSTRWELRSVDSDPRW